MALAGFIYTIVTTFGDNTTSFYYNYYFVSTSKETRCCCVASLNLIFPTYTNSPIHVRPVCSPSQRLGIGFR